MRLWPNFTKSGFRLCIVEVPGRPRVAVVDPLLGVPLAEDVLDQLKALGFQKFGNHGRYGINAKYASVPKLLAAFEGEMVLTPMESIVFPGKPKPVTARELHPAAKTEPTNLQAPQEGNDDEQQQPDSERPADSAGDADGAVGGDSPEPPAADEPEEAGEPDVERGADELPGGHPDPDDETGRSDDSPDDEAAPDAENNGHPGTDELSPPDSGSGDGEGAASPAGVADRAGRGISWTPEESDLVEIRGNKQRISANLDAVKLVAQLREEGRTATIEERKVLMKYSGWGGLARDITYGEQSYQVERMREEGLVSKEEYESWFDSDSNAYYTDYYLASGIWQAMIDNGFQGGRVAETSAGTGRFILTIPPDIAGNVELTAIEREHSSGQILHHLYGDTADVRISPYEKVFLPNETFDLAIGNIPFGDIKIFDRKEFGAKAELVHDYFMLRTLRKLKHGGVQAFITSTGTLDKKDDRVRREIAKSADLVGVIRLPRGVLKETAGTDISMDVLVFRKRYPGEEPGGMPFQKVVPIHVKAKTRVTVKEEATTYQIGETLQLPVNEALANRPELVGGEFVAVSGRFGPELATVFTQQEGDENFDLRTGVRGLLNTLSDVLPDDLFSRKPDGAAVSADEESIVEDESRIVGRREARAMVVQGFFIGDDGKVHVLTNLVEEVDPENGSRSWRTYSHVLALKPNDEARVKALVILRDQVRAHLLKESDPTSDEESVEESRRMLNESYDSFVADFGYINGRLNRKWVMEDAAAASLLGLESWDEDKGVATKADVMSRRVVAPAKPKDSASSLREAAVISFGQSGRINLDHVARLLNLSRDELDEQIGQTQDLFFDPASNQWQIRETYLSGNVRAKHEQAQSAAKMDSRFERNVAALAEVVPDYIPIDDIYVNLGSTWTSTDLYRDFTLSLLDGSKLTDVTIQFIPLLGQWDVKFADHLKSRYAAQMMEIYGTEKFPLDKVLGSALSGRPPVITYEHEGERVKDVEQSLQAQIKVDELKEAFRSWLQGQEGWKQRLEKEYNNRFNCYNWIDYDASDFDFPGLSPLWEPRPHQRSVVLRGLMEGNLLVAHCVGAGKTMEQAMMLMEAKRLGLLNKPVLTVPNHLLFQAAGAVKSYYPQSNICIVNKDDLATKDKRRAFVAKVAMNDWDMVVITHSMLKKIQVPLETEVEITSELVDEYQYMLAMVKQLSSREGGRSYSERTIFKKVSEERDRLKELVERLESGADNDLNMRELGIDGLAVDEAHKFKNLEIKTTLNIPGLTNSSSQQAFDLFLKSRYLMQRHGGEKGLYFYTGTPIANSMSELYTQHRFLRPSIYESCGIQDFVTWVSTFGEVTRNLEILPEGSGFQLKDRLSTFHNLPELLFMFRAMADVKSKEDLNLPTPEVKQETVVAPRTHWLRAYMRELAYRAGRVRNRMVEPSQDNLLKISSDGRKASLNMALVDKRIDQAEDDKCALLINNIEQIYHRTSEKKGAQAVFCDLGTPKKGAQAGEFSVYQLIKDKLIERGIPAEEIAFMQDATTDKQKLTLQQKVCSGAIRVIIGSTENMGTGANIQERLAALHNLDCPWRPCDLEQRLGRIDRQGNLFDEVLVYNYTTEDSFDLFMYEAVRRKARFIAQGMSDPRNIGRSMCEDADMNYAQIVAATTGNPMIGRKVEVDSEVMKLERMEAMHHQKSKRLSQIQAKQKGECEWLQSRYEGLSALGQRVLTGIQLRGSREFTLTLDGYIRDHQDGPTTWLNSSDANKALQGLLSGFMRSAKVGDQYTIGQFNDFRLDLRRMAGLAVFQLYDDMTFLEDFTCGEDLVFSSRRFSNWMAKLPEDIKAYRQRVEAITASIQDTEKSLSSDGAFARQEELDELRIEQKKINEELERISVNTKQEAFSFREYLEELIEESANDDEDIQNSLQQQLDLAAMF